jgi:hypothetical protein
MCPRCQSTSLTIRRLAGLEKILVFVTRKRKFFCNSCSFPFRAPDRRHRVRREPASRRELPTDHQTSLDQTSLDQTWGIGL